MTRYDLITNYRAGASIEEMEPSDDGEWVRYEDVEADLTRLRTELDAISALVSPHVDADPTDTVVDRVRLLRELHEDVLDDARTNRGNVIRLEDMLTVERQELTRLRTELEQVKAAADAEIAAEKDRNAKVRVKIAAALQVRIGEQEWDAAERLRSEREALIGYVQHKPECEMTPGGPHKMTGGRGLWWSINGTVREQRDPNGPEIVRRAVCTCGLDRLTTGQETP